MVKVKNIIVMKIFNLKENIQMVKDGMEKDVSLQKLLNMKLKQEMEKSNIVIIMIH